MSLVLVGFNISHFSLDHLQRKARTVTYLLHAAGVGRLPGEPALVLTFSCCWCESVAVLCVDEMLMFVMSVCHMLAVVYVVCGSVDLVLRACLSRHRYPPPHTPGEEESSYLPSPPTSRPTWHTHTAQDCQISDPATFLHLITHISQTGQYFHFPKKQQRGAEPVSLRLASF